ncbi:MAG: glycosyltransferase [Anaerolineae bacterium]
MITLITTVLNEGDNIRRLLDSLRTQTRQPDEIVIVDGGSRDDTVRFCANTTSCCRCVWKSRQAATSVAGAIWRFRRRAGTSSPSPTRAWCWLTTGCNT